MTNSRNKGASFEREIANELTTRLKLKHQLKRILEQTREKHLPDLILGRWYLECKRYGSGNEPMDSWWEQVVSASGGDKIPALIYKFDRRPIKVRVPLSILNENFSFNENVTCDLSFEDFIKFRGLQECRNKGKMRLEGKDYIVKDGDILNFRFNT